jgi:phosphonate degradation associated HDIG domain protein
MLLSSTFGEALMKDNDNDDTIRIRRKILSLFDERGDSLYGGEGVTQLQHALQAAHLAERANADPAQIMAALLHDVGHLLHNLPDDAPDHGIDDLHEELGNRWLQRWFVPAVCEPVRMHVASKRYLCAVEPAYAAGLSEPSRQSLALQGGPMSADEVAAFEASEFFRECVAVRRWDDLAKDPAATTPSLDYFLEHLSTTLLRNAPCDATA